MTVKGDIAAFLTSRHKLSNEDARDIAGAVFYCADDPDFAKSYHKWCGDDCDSNETDYWNVIKFLRETVE